MKGLTAVKSNTVSGFNGGLMGLNSKKHGDFTMKHVDWMKIFNRQTFPFNHQNGVGHSTRLGKLVDQKLYFINRTADYITFFFSGEYVGL